MDQRMNKREIYDHFAELEKQTQALVDSMEVLQNQINAVLEENAELSIENDHLHQVLKEERGRQKDGSSHLTPSRQNLQKLYTQGFHVCNEYYGKRLEDNESCTFCLETIFRDRAQDRPAGK